MPRSKYFQQLAFCCNHIASEISDNNGFVSVKKLVDRFGAKVFVRPLLVEGMLASSETCEKNKETGNHQWSLIIDSETHDVKEDDLANEKFGSPLSARFRNTVAHELAHSLAFRPTEFGMEFPKRFSSEKNKREFVEQIEKETEALSPLLLIPDIQLDKLFSHKKERITIEELCEFRKSSGISRSLVVNRLNLLGVSDEMRLKAHRPSLRNLAVGIGEWKAKGDAVLKNFPLYSIYDGGRAPGFIYQLQKGAGVSAKSIFSDSEFILCGGSQNTIECSVGAGTPKHPTLFKLPIRCAVERNFPKTGAEFLFIVQSTA
jgi:hypothetical protein